MAEHRDSSPQRTRIESREREGRLRPGRARRTTDVVSGTALRLLRLSRLVSRATGAKSTGSRSPKKSFTAQLKRRAVINVRYSANRMKGSWKAHGRYLERDSAAGQNGPVPEDRLGKAKDRRLDDLGREWQESGDRRLFKIIISPEDGSRADFGKAAEDLIAELEKRTGDRVEWAGIVHRNTDHPHAHLIIRGRTESGYDLRIPRQVVREHLRGAVQDSLTKQLGFRSLDDIRREREEEIQAVRATSIEPAISQTGCA
jgi:type IV secretory pathway VirD2 relaxase